jgi:hypothetical protein
MTAKKKGSSVPPADKGVAKKARRSNAPPRSAPHGHAGEGGIKRRDASGHLDPLYRAELIRLSSRPPPASDGVPFIGTNRTSDELAEDLGEHAVETATRGGDIGFHVLDVDAPEDLVSPFRMDGDEEEEEEEEEE